MKKFKSIISIVLLLTFLFSVNVQAASNYILIAGGKSKSSAPTIKLNQEYASSLSGKDELYFKFTTPSQKAFFDFYAKNINIETHSWSYDNQVKINLIDGVNEIMSSQTHGYGGESTNNIPLNPSTTYYINVYNNSPSDKPGNFKFKISYKYDYESDTKEEAKTVNLNTLVTKSMDGEDDVDWFKIKTSGYSKYDFYAKNINIKTDWPHTHITLYDSLNNKIEDHEVRFNESKVTTVTLTPNSTYYICIEAANYTLGNYSFKLSPYRYDITKSAFQHGSDYTYTGKAIYPSVTVLYGSKLLVKDRDYKVTYSNNVNCGIAEIKVTGIGTYKGTHTSKFYIHPKKATISKVTALKGKKIAVYLGKDSKASGYQIEYSTNSSFKGAKRVSVSGSKNTTKTISGLSGSKKYYVRARSYKRVGTKYIYGSWSSTKSVKTKSK